MKKYNLILVSALIGLSMTLPQVIFRQVPSKALDFDGIDYYLAVADAANSDSPIFSNR